MHLKFRWRVDPAAARSAPRSPPGALANPFFGAPKWTPFLPSRSMQTPPSKAEILRTISSGRAGGDQVSAYLAVMRGSLDSSVGFRALRTSSRGYCGTSALLAASCFRLKILMAVMVQVCRTPAWRRVPCARRACVREPPMQEIALGKARPCRGLMGIQRLLRWRWHARLCRGRLCCSICEAIAPAELPAGLPCRPTGTASDGVISRLRQAAW